MSTRARILERRAAYVALAVVAASGGACGESETSPCLAPPTCEDDMRKGILPNDTLEGALTLCAGESTTLHVTRRCRFGETRTITKLSCESGDESVIAVDPAGTCKVRAMGTGVATVVATSAEDGVSNERLTLTVTDCAEAGPAD